MILKGCRGGPWGNPIKKEKIEKGVKTFRWRSHTGPEGLQTTEKIKKEKPILPVKGISNGPGTKTKRKVAGGTGEKSKAVCSASVFEGRIHKTSISES